jgi:glycine cleavage system H protein
MKSIEELNLPDDLRYAEDHEWALKEGENFRIGISDYAQDQLGDIVFVELPKVGDILARKQQFGTVESVKAVAELYIPMGGEIVSVNGDLEGSPETVNSDPYEKGWMVLLRPTDPAEFEMMMTKSAYIQDLEGKK